MMPYEEKDGRIIVTRAKDQPDSMHHIERDDPFFPALKPIFTGEKLNFTFEEIASSIKGRTPELAFAHFHQHYGYICIGTGENPALNEVLTEEQKKLRQVEIQKSLELAKLPHTLIKGRYMGVDEYSYFIPFYAPIIGLGSVLQSEIIKKIETLASAHNQDSLLVCHQNRSCYIYTSGDQKGSVIIGQSAVIYKGKEQLPDDCYTLFINEKNASEQVEENVTGFTCGLDFSRVYSTVEEYVAEENETLQRYYGEFITSLKEEAKPIEQVGAIEPTKKMLILLRGADGYNDYAEKLKRSLTALGKKVGLLGTDANIAKINEEVAEDNRNGGPKAGWQWPQIREEFVKRNRVIFKALLDEPTIDVIIYADMNKLVDFMKPYILEAHSRKYHILINVVNSFVFEHGRSRFVEKLCADASFMVRHLADFYKEESQINAPSIHVEGIEIEQRRVPVLKENELAIDVCSMLKQESEEKAVVTLLQGSGFFAVDGLSSMDAEQVDAPRVTSL